MLLIFFSLFSCMIFSKIVSSETAVAISILYCILSKVSINDTIGSKVLIIIQDLMVSLIVRMDRVFSYNQSLLNSESNPSMLLSLLIDLIRF